MLGKNWFYIGYSPSGSKTLFIPEEKLSIWELEKCFEDDTDKMETFSNIAVILTTKNGTQHYFTERLNG